MPSTLVIGGERSLATLCSGGLAFAFAFALGGCSAEDTQMSGAPPFEQEASSALGDGPLLVTLHPGAEGTGTIEYELTNAGAEPVRFLARDTALQGAFSDQFEVLRAGVPARYVGASVVPASPETDGYVELAPGEARTRTIDLTWLYDVQPGQYLVRARASRGAMLAQTGARTAPRAEIVVDGSALDISIDERLIARFGDPLVEKQVSPDCIEQCQDTCTIQVDPAGIGPCQSACPSQCEAQGFGRFGRRCNAAEEATIAAALTEMRRTAAAGAAAAGTSLDYFTWFGTRTIDRAQIVEDMLTGIANDRFRVECLPGGFQISSEFGCPPTSLSPALATTNGRLGGDVGLCPNFFSGLSLLDQGTTMVHESAHRLGADDIVRSPGDAQRLAADEPDNAIRSAENYEGFASEF